MITVETIRERHSVREYDGRSLAQAEFDALGAVVEECDENGFAKLTQRNKFCTGDTLELLTREQPPIVFTAGAMQEPDGTMIESTPRAMMEFRMQLPAACSRLSVLRRVKEDPKRTRV